MKKFLFQKKITSVEFHPIHQISLVVTCVFPELNTFMRGIHSDNVGLVRGQTTVYLQTFPKRATKKISTSVRTEVRYSQRELL